MTQYKDISIKGFNFRFVKEGDEWVCKMPEWLLKNAEDLFKWLENGMVETHHYTIFIAMRWAESLARLR